MQMNDIHLQNVVLMIYNFRIENLLYRNNRDFFTLNNLLDIESECRIYGIILVLTIIVISSQELIVKSNHGSYEINKYQNFTLCNNKLYNYSRT